MKTAVAISLIAASPAAATKCSAGYTHKKDLTGLFCGNANADSDACNDGCCEYDTTTCGGVAGSGKRTCGFGLYADTSSDTWRATKTTAYDKDKSPTFDQSQFEKDCCKPASTCASTTYTCPGGFKKKTAAGIANIHCPGNGATCANTMCCEEDKNTCGGYWLAPTAKGGLNKAAAALCKLADKVYPQAATDKALGNEKWRAIRNPSTTAWVSPAGNTKWEQTCCIAQPTCADTGYKCPAGYMKDTTKKTNVCGKDADGNYPVSQCASVTAGVGVCCKKDPATCGGSPAAVCTAAQYAPTSDVWKAKKIVVGKQDIECCTEKADCAVAQCPSGYSKKANVDTLSCPNDKESCGTTAARCCEVNKLTCGGLLSSIACPFGFYNEAAYFNADTPQATKDAWRNKPTTQATRNTDCCTAKAQCVAEFATTTPAATVTPIAPARLYTAHKEAASDKKKENSALWMAAGALMGAAVVMGVQRMRSSEDSRAIAIE